jgi:protein-tyrosine phosphatase
VSPPAGARRVFRFGSGALSMTASVLFVCWATSSLATAGGRAAARTNARAHLFIDSAGTGNWHVGKSRTEGPLLSLSGTRGHSGSESTPGEREDFYRFDHIVALDSQNLSDLRALRRRCDGGTLDFCSTMWRERRPSPSQTPIMARRRISTLLGGCLHGGRGSARRIASRE